MGTPRAESWSCSRMKSDKKPDVCVVGLGYIGLPTAAVIARAGCKVLGLDVSQKVVDTINRGEIHIEEVDLDGLVHGVVARGLLRSEEHTSELQSLMRNSYAVFCLKKKKTK